MNYKQWNCGEHLLNLDKIKIMGILNITPDSFYDGGKYFDYKLAINHILKMQDIGADIIDVGAQSTRPGFTKISEKEELERLDNFFYELKKNKDKITSILSIDTFYPSVAKQALKNGFSIINDVTGILNPKMFNIIYESNPGIIIMHNNEPWNNYYDNDFFKKTNILDEIKNFFEYQVNFFLKNGINLNRICLDPGIGFGKTLDQNFYIIKNIDKIRIKNLPILTGTSNKRITKEYLIQKNDKKTQKFNNKSIEIMSINNNSNILRVHDILNCRETLEFFNK